MLDTETTGINKRGGRYYEGHRIIEIGAVEVINRHITGRNFHVYLKPNRIIDQEAWKIHGISWQFLADKPTFAQVADELLEFISGSELVIHNAPFDLGFIDYEFSKLNRNICKINTVCKVTDSLLMARKMFPGQRNSLDALCDRYMIDKSKRKIHSALLDAEVLADVFLLMTSCQTSISFDCASDDQKHDHNSQAAAPPTSGLKVIYANDQEVLAHDNWLDLLSNTSLSGSCLWRLD